jgi:hypothetical protein
MWVNHCAILTFPKSRHLGNKLHRVVIRRNIGTGRIRQNTGQSAGTRRLRLIAATIAHRTLPMSVSSIRQRIEMPSLPLLIGFENEIVNTKATTTVLTNANGSANESVHAQVDTHRRAHQSLPNVATRRHH